MYLEKKTWKHFFNQNYDNEIILREKHKLGYAILYLILLQELGIIKHYVDLFLAKNSFKWIQSLTCC